jgi:hypothetical protein
MAADKKIGVVGKAQEFFLRKGEVVIPARKAKRIRRAATRAARRK